MQKCGNCPLYTTTRGNIVSVTQQLCVGSHNNYGNDYNTVE